MKNIYAESLVAVHTHTHTHTQGHLTKKLNIIKLNKLTI